MRRPAIVPSRRHTSSDSQPELVACERNNGQEISDKRGERRISNQNEELNRDGGSADSVSICCSRNRLPPSDMNGPPFSLKFGGTDPVCQDQSIPAGVSL